MCYLTICLLVHRVFSTSLASSSPCILFKFTFSANNGNHKWETTTNCYYCLLVIFFFLLFSPSLPLSESEFAYAYVFGEFKMERNREYPSTSPTRARERQHSTSTTCPWGVQEWEIRGKLCRDLNNDGRSQGTLGEGILWETRNYLFFSIVFFFLLYKKLD
jgi:hypothetical protein